MAMKIWSILKAILPTKRIGAWILGVLAALTALVMGVKNTELKEQFCANPVVELPKIEMVTPTATITIPKEEGK